MSSIGPTIRKLRQAKGLTLNQMATLIESDVGNLSRLERDQQGFSAPLLQRIADVLEVPVAALFKDAGPLPLVGVMEQRTTYEVSVPDEADPRFYHIKKVKLRLSAGVTGFQTASDNGDLSTMPLPKVWVDSKGFDPARLIAIRVKGESMEPSLYEDDVVIINTADMKMVDGAVFAINYEGEAVIKRLERDLGQWWLASDNPDKRRYPRKMCQNGECIMVGRIVRKESERI